MARSEWYPVGVCYGERDGVKIQATSYTNAKNRKAWDVVVSSPSRHDQPRLFLLEATFYAVVSIVPSPFGPSRIELSKKAVEVDALEKDIILTLVNHWEINGCSRVAEPK